MLARLVKFLTSGGLPALASQSAGITGMSHYARPTSDFLIVTVTDYSPPKDSKACFYAIMNVNYLIPATI